MFVYLTCDHHIPERLPIQVQVGQKVHVGQRDTDWPEFVFVTTGEGQGWVPARYLEIDGSDGVVLVEYDTTELAASKGEQVELVVDDAQSGWAWCRNSQGEEGWIPHRCLGLAEKRS
ncbi:SH3 domain-containing protein [Boudabousia tangfeifanii]|uniref:SH3 domain-containing protein n=1 Tax=Boudabousia tangfeifanii TaxID=1912795 RepID=UPI0009F4F744|nr:SH3 domain-containing protein [Boudabousia tangfeifanii]